VLRYVTANGRTTLTAVAAAGRRVTIGETRMVLTIEQHQARYGGMLAMRGIIVLMLALLSLLQAERFFLTAILGVASLLVVFGLYEIVNAYRMRELSFHQWWLPLLDGSAAVFFGIVSMSVTLVGMRVAIWLMAAWFMYYALCLIIAAGLSDRRESVRHTLFVAGLFHVLGGAAVLLMPIHPRISMLALPLVGAAYVVLFGAWQISAGSWLIHNAKSANEREVFLAPTFA